MNVSFRSVVLASAALIALTVIGPSARAQATEAAARKPLLLENYTNELWIARYAADQAPVAVYQRLAANPELALYAQVFSYGSSHSHYCVAHVGVTHAAPDLKSNPRAPAVMGWGGASGRESDAEDGADGCAGRALKRAVRALFALDDPLADVESTAYAGGRRAKEAADPGTIRSTRFGINPNGAQYVRDQMPDWFGSALDYRQYQTRTIWNNLAADNDERICFAYLGITGRAPSDRTPRIPSSFTSLARLLPASDSALADQDGECFDPLFKRLGSEITPDSALLRNFVAKWAAIGEPGLPAPDQKKIDAAIKTWQHKAAAAQARQPGTTARSRSDATPSDDRPAAPPRCINPATGLPMMALDGSCGGFDVMGNPYGFRNH